MCSLSNNKLLFSHPNSQRRYIFGCFILTILLLLTSSLKAAEPSWANGTSTPYRTKVDAKLKDLLIAAIEDTSGFTDRFDAEVWLLDMSTRMKKQVPNPQERLEILKHVHQEATRVNLQPELVLSVIQVESNFDQYAISWVGARGLMQIMPFWLKEIGHPNDNLFDIKTNLRFGCTILSYYLKIEKGNLFRALGRYNGSLGKAKYPKKVLKAMSNKWYVQ
ncbi:MAG: lytic transglycosylase domain-containing protein [gamma proteobacterium symbiont of Bathyaustriella thionipta]|nr:lytic transglycosylase domain-containing protein [gamma proteobacterium symbiont of Bathyaustriella thionipta]MCU7949305.1 lytic transglycosylase domain-containing protein [gamma proteobacterium symbiont of Bathyaustriella thionipta]MCU7954459.1 lytic transglycosylase domain-containing protein [gamma proteobacterium symbiont of Bathyaustriella thionipta]MCU7958110.1 lytic transglycosylase domain-containing protein [gamma proteobacterium symbiont of Bathyaustriella thionipta]MCU7968540.1 lyti